MKIIYPKVFSKRLTRTGELVMTWGFLCALCIDCNVRVSSVQYLSVGFVLLSGLNIIELFETRHLVLDSGWEGPFVHFWIKPVYLH